MRTVAGLFAVLVLGCASSKGAVGGLRSGAEVVLETTSGPRQGELFAVSRDTVWLCDDGASIAVPTSTLRSARPVTAERPLDVTAPETWAGIARHPEGAPSAGTHCRLTHEDQPTAYVVAKLPGDVTLQGPLLAVDASTVVIEVEKAPRCAAVKELASLKVLLARDAPRKDGDSGAGAGLAALALVAWPVAALVGAAALVDLAARGERAPEQQHFLAEVDLARLTALKPVARYPAGLPPTLTCAATPDPASGSAATR